MEMQIQRIGRVADLNVRFIAYSELESHGQSLASGPTSISQPRRALSPAMPRTPPALC